LSNVAQSANFMVGKLRKKLILFIQDNTMVKYRY
jgi:hypothetical protein